MPWHESQLIGTVIGTFLGFLLAFIPNALEKRRIRKCLLRLLMAEIASVTNQLRESIGEYRSTLEAVSTGEECEIYISGRRLDEIFTANLVNMSTFQPHYAELIFDFYQSVSKQRGLVSALSQDKVEKGEDSTEFRRALCRVIALMEEGISKGERLTKELGTDMS